MPVNRNAFLRYQVIDRCLQNRGRKWTWQDILDKVNEALQEENPKSKGIRKTTIFEDIKDIEYRVFNAEIKRTVDGKKKYYSYADPKYSINNQPLSDAEARHLKSAISVLSRFKGLPQFEWVNEIVPAIQSKMGLVNVGKEIISFDNNVDYVGLSHIPELFNAIINKRVIRILYKDFKRTEPYEIEIHPQYLKQYNSRWFVISFMEMWRDKPQTHALDRIRLISETGSTSRSFGDFDWDDYFSDMIGVSRNDNAPVEIRLLIVDEEQAAYINTKPLHLSQKKVKKVKDGYETSIMVVQNYELETLILSFGERVKVLSPVDLRKRLEQRIRRMYDNTKEPL